MTSTAQRVAPKISAPGLFADGGCGTSLPDLWATYAAVRTLTWLEEPLGPQLAQRTIDYLLSWRNQDGGCAWQRGLSSDVWATYYGYQALRDLGHQVEVARLREWLSRAQSDDGGFGMMPGQGSDVWATYYASRLFREVVGVRPPAETRLIDWLGSLQTASGGLSWCPGSGAPDVRACYYGVHALAATAEKEQSPWRARELRDWLAAQQDPAGGFRFNEESSPCLWATFRATMTFERAGWPVPNSAKCTRWIMERFTDDGFIRWQGHNRTDVWANFSAVGSLLALEASIDRETVATVRRAVLRAAFADGGFTYREPDSASDAMSSAAALIIKQLNDPKDSDIRSICRWLREAHMRWEDGVMYMPGRGAEVRCTLWALSALKLTGKSFSEPARLGLWLMRLQNPDGGFGYWSGRGSDIPSSMSAMAVAVGIEADAASPINKTRLINFVARCTREDGASATPGGSVSASATAQAVRLYRMLGVDAEAQRLLQVLKRFAILGGFRETLSEPPNLYTTYQCVLAAPQDTGARFDGLTPFLNKLTGRDGSVGWTPFQHSGDLLARTLFALLRRKAAQPDFRLPELVLT